MADIFSKMMEAPISPPTPRQVRRARLYVAGNAYDATDAHDLLEALGLLEETPDDAA